METISLNRVTVVLRRLLFAIDALVHSPGCTSFLFPFHPQLDDANDDDIVNDAWQHAAGKETDRGTHSVEVHYCVHRTIVPNRNLIN